MALGRWVYCMTTLGSMNVPDLRQKMLADAEDLLVRVAFCVAVERDRAFQQRLRSIAGGGSEEPLLVRPPASQAWLILGFGGAMQVVRDAPGDLRRVVLDDLAGHDEELLRDAIAMSWQTQAHSEAMSLLTPIFDTQLSPSGDQIAQLLRWAPIIEHVAYRYVTYAATLVDLLRPSVLAGTSASKADSEIGLRNYWSVLHTMGHLLTIASSPGARPWLADLASSFTWVTWTPSFALSRERTLWLTAAAAKSAVAFGETVTDNYLTKLSASDHPVKSFDALVGLLAIGLDQPRLTGSLLSELEVINASAAHNRSPGAGHIRLMLNAAIATLREPDESERHFAELNGTRDQQFACDLLGLDALRRDPTDFLPSGDALGFAALPMIVRTDPAEYYPRRSARGLMIRPREIKQIIKRAWASSSSGTELRTVH